MLNRDERRFRKRYEATYGAVLAYALRRTDQPADAHDVVAETFLTAWRRRAVLPEGERTLPWLYGVAYRVIANQARSRRRSERLSAQLAAQPRPSPQVEADVLRAAELEAIRSALERLDPMEQEVLRLAAWEGLSRAEISDVLGCSENAATLRLHRARKRLAEELAKENELTGHESA
ncbi:MAG: RNA polymerase sigma factor [Actinobacteria bacterium]|nr:RNA polymerase sigma factor [Actinomycetota bacterium]